MMRWFAAELDADNRRMIYAPAGFAHGFQTLEPDAELFYQRAASFRPELQRGVRWHDPTLAVAWPPAGRRVISARDQALPFLAAAADLGAIDGEIDRIALAAFDVFAECREQVYQLRIEEVKRRVAWVVGKMNQGGEDPEA